jgi:hypothetical protein
MLSMPRGIRYVNLFYPGRIQMPEGYGFMVNVDGQQGSLLLYKQLNVAEVLDFTNAIEERTEGVNAIRQLRHPIEAIPAHNIGILANGELSYVMDRETHYYRIFKPRVYTELFVTHEVADTEHLTEQENGLYTRILGAFLQAYRLFTQDIAIRLPDDLQHEYPVIRAALYDYTPQDLEESLQERITKLRDCFFGIASVPLGVNPSALNRPTVDAAIVGPRISGFLAAGETTPKPQEALLKALEELKVNSNYRYAFLLAFFAFEAVISDFLRHIKLGRGVSPGKLKEYEKDLGISYMVNIDLPLVTYPDKRIQEILSDLNRVNTIRNGIVHKARDVSQEEAAFAITTVSKLFEILATRRAAREPQASPAAVPTTEPAPGR